MPALGYALSASDGPVLEIGIGHFSTPFLHEYCRGSNRNLISVEDNKLWMDGFVNLKSPFHGFRVDYESLSEGIEWGVVFIDNSPGGEARAKPFDIFLSQSQFVVVHDFHKENSDAINPLIDKYKPNFRLFNDYDPPTLLASINHKVT